MPPKRNAARSVKQRQTYEDDPETVSEQDACPSPPKRSKVKQADRPSLPIEPTTKKSVVQVPSSSSITADTQQVQQTLQDLQKKLATPKDSWFEKFVKEVEKQRAEVGSLSKQKDAERTGSHAKFVKQIKEQIDVALASPDTTSTKKQSTARKTTPPSVDELYAAHPLYAASNAWLNITNATVGTYNEACKLISDAKPEQALVEKWQEGHDGLVEMLEKGRRTTERQVQGLIEGKGGGVVTAREERARRHDHIFARNMLGMKNLPDIESAADAGELPWLESVRSANGGAKRFAAGLPLAVGVAEDRERS